MALSIHDIHEIHTAEFAQILMCWKLNPPVAVVAVDLERPFKMDNGHAMFRATVELKLQDDQLCYVYGVFHDDNVAFGLLHTISMGQMMFIESAETCPLVMQQLVESFTTMHMIG